MEDASVVVDDISTLGLSLDPTIVWPEHRLWFGVFDGHHGACCAQYAACHLHERVLESQAFPNNIEQAMVQAFSAIDSEYLDKVLSHGDYDDSGCTALAGLIWGGNLVLGNVGDCRAVVSRKGKAVELTRDHKTRDETELRRILDNGGFLDDNDLLNGELGVARALGNHIWATQLRAPGTRGEPLLSSRPEIQRHKLHPDDEFMVVASDGLWDIATSQRVVELGRMFLMKTDCYDAQKCAQYLVRYLFRCQGQYLQLPLGSMRGRGGNHVSAESATGRGRTAANTEAVEALHVSAELFGRGCQHVQVQQAAEKHSADNVSVLVITFKADPPARRFRTSGSWLNLHRTSKCASATTVPACKADVDRLQAERL